MGWNKVRHNGHPLWAGIEQDTRFYFVHSYYVDAAEPEQVAATCDYGHTFAAALQRNNLFAVQFHPEKSHTAGLQLLRNFVAWNGRSEEHTSELQSRGHLVCRLLLEKKNTTRRRPRPTVCSTRTR